MKKFQNVAWIGLILLTFSGCQLLENLNNENKLIPVRSGELYQYIDNEGQILINPQFNRATKFREGFALVQSSGSEPKWGYISEDGRFAVAPKFESATVFSENIAWVVAKNSAPAAINGKGEVLFKVPQSNKVNIYKEGLASYSVITDFNGEEKWGFLDKQGKSIVNPQFSATGFFSQGKCAVANNNGQWGYVNPQGQIVINYQFDLAAEFKDGTAIVYKDGKAGVINEKGTYIINPQYLEICHDDQGYLFNQDGKYGWCDKEGKITINPQFDGACPFRGSSLAAVKSGENWGYIDDEGKLVINPQFAFAYPFDGDLACVLSGSKYGFIDQEGKYKINPQFEDVDIDFEKWEFEQKSKGSCGTEDLSFEIWSFQGVESDFFDIDAIIDQINLKNPEGLSVFSRLSEINARFKKNVFSNEFNNWHQVFKGKRITNDANIDFWVNADERMEIPDGWYTKTVLDLNARVNGYAYLIHLVNKGYDKQQDVLEALENSLIGYQRDYEKSNNNQSAFTNNYSRVIFLSQQEGEIQIQISKK